MPVPSANYAAYNGLYFHWPTCLEVDEHGGFKKARVRIAAIAILFETVLQYSIWRIVRQVRCCDALSTSYRYYL